MGLNKEDTASCEIRGKDTRINASIIKEEMKKMGVEVVIISKEEDLIKYTNGANLELNQVVFTLRIPGEVDRVQMFRNMLRCLGDTS